MRGHKKVHNGGHKNVKIKTKIKKQRGVLKNRGNDI